MVSRDAERNADGIACEGKRFGPRSALYFGNDSMLREMAMRFHSATTSVELTIQGYQYPDILAGYDANWLMIHGSVELPGNHWEFNDPCLLTSEAKRLADWLDDVAKGSDTPTSIHFFEPNLTFEISRHTGATVLCITFDLESRPPGMKRGEKASAEFLIEASTLRRELSHWRDQLSMFPQREDD